MSRGRESRKREQRRDKHVASFYPFRLFPVSPFRPVYSFPFSSFVPLTLMPLIAQDDDRLLLAAVFELVQGAGFDATVSNRAAHTQR